MTRSLEGRTILITRPRDQAGEMASLLEARGARPILAPTIRIEPVRTPALRQALRQLAGGAFEWVTLSSRATVEILATRLEPGDVRAKVAAVGEGTAETFRRWTGRRPELVPATFTTESLSRAMPRGRGRILCLRADVAPDGLEGALARKGWSAVRIDAYRTSMPRAIPAEARRALRDGEVDAVTFTSASTVVGFAKAVGRLERVPKVVCIGPVTARSARAHGFRVDAVARPHTIEGVVAALERVLAGSTRGPRRRAKEIA